MALTRAPMLISLRLCLLLLASYGMLYFSYRYYIPWSGGNDFSQYYGMYLQPFDFTAAPAPFVYRQVSALLTHLVYALGIYYPGVTWFHDPGYDPRIFFAALFTNYLCLVASAFIVGRIVEERLGRRDTAYALLAGFFCLVSFDSQQYVVTGLTEGVNWLIMALLFLLYLRQNRAGVVLLLALSVLQRETIPVAMGVIAAFAWLLKNGDRRYNGFVVLASLAAFAAYLVLRKYVIAAPGYAEQLSPAYLLHSLTTFRPTKQIVLQDFVSQNVVAICLVLGLLSFLATRRLSRFLPVLLAAYAILVFIGVAEGIGNNIGRITGIMTPLFAAVAALSLREDERGYAETLADEPPPRQAEPRMAATSWWRQE